MPGLQLGNEQVIEPVKPDPGSTATVPVPRPDLGRRVHHIGIPPGWPLSEAMIAVRTFVENSFGEPPSWVESDSELYALAVAEEYGCRIGRPRGWTEGPVDDDEKERGVDGPLKQR